MKKIILCVLILVLAACNQTASNKVVSDQPVYDRINATNTIRCGYSAWPPYFSIDANTKKLGGIFYDVTEEMGKRLHLKIDWVEEVGWSAVTEAIKTKRFDMACSAYWLSTARARQIDFSRPLYYSVIYLWTRSNETRQFNSFDDLDKPEISFGHIESAPEAESININFPNAKKYVMPELSSPGDQFESFRSGKFDIMAMDDGSISNYLKQNPGSFKKIFPDNPLAAFPNVMLIPAGETKLKSMIDNTLSEMQNDGTTAKISKKYGVENMAKLPAKPYQD